MAVKVHPLPEIPLNETTVKAELDPPATAVELEWRKKATELGLKLLRVEIQSAVPSMWAFGLIYPPKELRARDRVIGVAVVGNETTSVLTLVSTYDLPPGSKMQDVTTTRRASDNFAQVEEICLAERVTVQLRRNADRRPEQIYLEAHLPVDPRSPGVDLMSGLDRLLRTMTQLEMFLSGKGLRYRIRRGG